MQSRSIIIDAHCSEGVPQSLSNTASITHARAYTVLLPAQPPTWSFKSAPAYYLSTAHAHMKAEWQADTYNDQASLHVAAGTMLGQEGRLPGAWNKTGGTSSDVAIEFRLRSMHGEACTESGTSVTSQTTCSAYAPPTLEQQRQSVLKLVHHP